MTVIELDGIKNPKHQAVIRQISDIFDESRGKIREDVAFTKFDNDKHVILFNTKSPELDGTFLIPYNNDKLLFAPATVKLGVSNQTEHNAAVNLIFNKDNGKNRVWEVVSEDKTTVVLFITMQEKTPIAGFSVMFADSVKTKYKMEVVLANEENEIVSQASGMESSWDSNNHQFFQFSNVVDDVIKVKLDINVVGNTYEWRINNISFYSSMNMESLKNLNDLGVLNWTLVHNPVLINNLKDGDLTGGETPTTTTTTETLKMDSQQVEGEYRDNFGSPLPFEPDTSRQYFDSLTQDQISGMSNIRKLHSVTESPTKGEKIFTFETDSTTRNLELKFQPLEEQNKYSDQPVLDFNQLISQGYMKKGGFKNYMLTFYMRLDEITLQDQNLIWKMAGWISEPNLPDHSRFTDVFIPIGSQSKPRIYSEYRYNAFKELKSVTGENQQGSNNIEEGKWVGFQFVRQVDEENNESTISIGINRNPIDEKGNLQGQFEPFLEFTDSTTEDHIANVWGGCAEYIIVSGARYVSLCGISLYEIK